MNILNRIYIHPYTYFLFLLSIMTGMFKEFFMIFIIIIIHELGHLIVAIILKWNTGKIKIYPFGGCCNFEEIINKPLKEELLILIAGPITQMFAFIIVSFLNTKIPIMIPRNYQIFKSYNYAILFFNLLPVYPLDGGRILNIICYYILPYKISNRIIVFISFVILIIQFYQYKNLNFAIMMIILIIEIIMYYKRQNHLYNRFLLERYLNSYSFKKEKIINNKDNMYKDKRHVIFYKNKYITEREYLKQRFKVKK